MYHTKWPGLIYQRSPQPPVSYRTFLFLLRLCNTDLPVHDVGEHIHKALSVRLSIYFLVLHVSNYIPPVSTAMKYAAHPSHTAFQVHTNSDSIFPSCYLSPNTLQGNNGALPNTSNFRPGKPPKSTAMLDHFLQEPAKAAPFNILDKTKGYAASKNNDFAHIGAWA